MAGVASTATAGLAPGVHFQWLDRPSPPGLPATDVAGFVGFAERGPLDEPVRVRSTAQFASIFGAALPFGHLAVAVGGFFANGGRSCWVVRAASRAPGVGAA